MSSSDEKVNKIEQILNDVSERVEKLEQGINEFKSGFTESGSDDSRNPEYNGSKPMVQTQLDSIRPNRKPNGQQVNSIHDKIRIRIDYLKNAGIPETDDEVIMLNDVLKGNFRGGRRTRRMRRGRSTKRRVTIHNKTRSHKKARSHKKRH